MEQISEKSPPNPATDYKGAFFAGFRGFTCPASKTGDVFKNRFLDTASAKLPIYPYRNTSTPLFVEILLAKKLKNGIAKDNLPSMVVNQKSGAHPVRCGSCRKKAKEYAEMKYMIKTHTPGAREMDSPPIRRTRRAMGSGSRKKPCTAPVPEVSYIMMLYIPAVPPDCHGKLPGGFAFGFFFLKFFILKNKNNRKNIKSPIDITTVM